MKGLATISMAMLVALFAVPVLGIVVLSFSPTYGIDIFTSPHPSLRWWRELLADSSWGVCFATFELPR